MIVGTIIYKLKINNNQEENIVNEEEYVGEEEQYDIFDDKRSYDEIAIQIAENEWGDSDQSVRFSIEQKDGAIYHIAVKKDATVITWYEINVEEKTISEYY